MVACRYGISLLAFNSTSHSFAALTRELSSLTLEEKFHVYARPCIILYLSNNTSWVNSNAEVTAKSNANNNHRLKTILGALQTILQLTFDILTRRD